MNLTKPFQSKYPGRTYISICRLFFIPILIALSMGCQASYHTSSEASKYTSLLLKLNEIVNHTPGTVGIAIVSDHDTLTINNGVHYPMMSVFKLHQSLAVAHTLEERMQSLDTIIHIKRSELDPNTWSPMLKDFKNEEFSISIGRLVEYALTASDNNASNLLFESIVSPAETDKYIRTIAPDTTFRILYSEAEMKADHNLAYQNFTSPLSAALLIRRIYDKPDILSHSLDYIKEYLSTVTTGQDRLGKPVANNPDVYFAHKTGSGYRNERGELAAHNDVGFFRLPDGREYTLAVFIRDFEGSEAEASQIMAHISQEVYSYFINQ